MGETRRTPSPPPRPLPPDPVPAFDIDSVLNVLSEGVLWIDADDRIRHINAAMDPWINRPVNSAIGSRLWEVLRHREIADMATTVRPGSPVEKTIVFPLTVERLGHVRCHAMTDGKGGHDRLFVFTDVTRTTQLENTRKEFVANVSHELKTPLTALRAALETLTEGAIDDPAAAKDFLATAQDQVERLQRLIDELLTLSRLEKPGAAPPAGARAEVADVARRVAAALVPLARKKSVTISVDNVPENLVVALSSDELTQILMNLLDNAIKFNRDGGRVSVSAQNREGSLEIVVEDTGVGIGMEDQKRLFERFYRVDKARGAGGTGLGLSIVKHIVENRGGPRDGRKCSQRRKPFHRVTANGHHLTSMFRVGTKRDTVKK